MDALDSLLIQQLIQNVRLAMQVLWPCKTERLHLAPEISREKFYEYACVPPHLADQEHRDHFTEEGLVLRRQLADVMPQYLRVGDLLSQCERMLLCMGPIYQSEGEGSLEERQELALWRLVAHDIELLCVDQVIDIVRRVLPKGLRIRTRRCNKAYLVYGRGIEVHAGSWIWIGHAGLINPMLLIEHGLDSAQANGLALSLDLDRCQQIVEGHLEQGLKASAEAYF
jgi:hypothetical protein